MAYVFDGLFEVGILFKKRKFILNTSIIKKRLFVSLIMLITGLVMWLCATYEIFYPETYFTYQAKLGDFVAFNVSQHYQGERFIEGDVIYQILGERQVSRIENRFLIVGSTLCILLSVVVAAFSKKHLLIKPLNKV